MEWNVEAFRQHCVRLDLPDTSVFLSSLELKNRRTRFYGRLAKDVWKDYYLSKNGKIKFSEESFGEAIFAYESHVESSLYSLYSMADIMAQIINSVALSEKFPEDAVTLSKVSRRINHENKVHQVIDAIQQMKNSDEFRFVAGFVNVLKHRKMVEAYVKLQFDKRDENIFGISFRGFEYGEEIYPSVLMDLIINEITEEFIDRLIYIGTMMNDYLEKSLNCQNKLPAE
ncbi:hypothetical protein EV586_103156 [Tumebacillus sp. BK434]|uniref:hypothetical protein n=1 Tax=Tumebacillus sp. BK434 TaxID=2512169 RepID=UPI0010513AA3|nr:hypothetical protein [Tumebacillus sp. BK434]TCP55504.1 hypothetical protein EV586_103156 [Tumebacillus sp. BK434]